MLHPLSTQRYVDLVDQLNLFVSQVRNLAGAIYSRNHKEEVKENSWLGKFVRLPGNTKCAGKVTEVFSHGITIKTVNNTQVYIPFGSQIITIEGDR